MNRPRIKVCGMTRAEDVREAVRLGTDAIGFVLWERSPRCIGTEEAARIASTIPPFVTRVGVFVDATPDEVARAVHDIGLDTVQLHGDETVELYGQVGARLIKAVAPATSQDVEDAIALPADVAVLVDARDEERRGGTGQVANWAYAAEIARSRPVILAGGITAQNVAAAIAAVRPWALDVSSGVEDSPGIKSHPRLREFFFAFNDDISRPRRKRVQ
jgi:phosphoribosylanthranilate isomerase